MLEWNGSFERVNINSIVVDHRYQRDERPALINSISNNVSWEPFGVLTCIRRKNGIFYCVDGQQRLAGLKASNDPPKEVPVVWFEVPSEQEEARIYGVINEARKALYPMDKHKGRVFSEDDRALAIEAICETAGYTLGKSGGGDSPRTLRSITALYKLYDLLGEDGLLQVLTVIREAWPDDAHATSSLMLVGVGDLIQAAGDGYSRAKTIAALKKTLPSKVLRRADELVLDVGGTKRTNVARALRQLAK